MSGAAAIAIFALLVVLLVVCWIGLIRLGSALAEVPGGFSMRGGFAVAGGVPVRSINSVTWPLAEIRWSSEGIEVVPRRPRLFQPVHLDRDGVETIRVRRSISGTGFQFLGAGRAPLTVWPGRPETFRSSIASLGWPI